MLTLTPAAEEAVRQIVAQAPVNDDTGGLRIARGQPTPEGVPLEMSLVDAPEDADQEVGEANAHVYVEPSAAELLDDKVLDAQVQGGRVGFAVRDAGGEGGGSDDSGQPPPA
jgi:Fe-S cluster assembly iron-binding protein IscA